MGRSLDDVRSLVLTHGHSDHIGFAERLRSERGVPVRVHEADAALARGEVPNPAKGFGPTRIRPLIEFIWFTMRKGGLRIPRLVEVSTFGDGATLDVPGSPRVILVPGSHARQRRAPRREPRARCSSATRSRPTPSRPASPARRSPRSPPTATRPSRRSRDSRASRRRYVLPGHGQPWTGGVAEAVRLVRASAAAP